MSEKTAEDLVEDEILRRLKDDPHVVPATALFQFYRDMQKARERRERENNEEESKPFNLMDELPTLPPKQALELAKEEVVRLEREIDGYYKVIHELEEGLYVGEEIGSGHRVEAGEGGRERGGAFGRGEEAGEGGGESG